MRAAPTQHRYHSHRVWHFSLYDGHGGVRCAAYASQHLHPAVMQAGLLTSKVRGWAGLVVCLCVTHRMSDIDSE